MCDRLTSSRRLACGILLVASILAQSAVRAEGPVHQTLQLRRWMQARRNTQEAPASNGFTPDPTKKFVCVYHGADADGQGSAFAVRCWLKNEQSRGKTYGATSFVRGDYSKPAPQIDSNTDIVICDFSFPRDVMTKMRETTRGRVLVLDHHASAKQELAGLPYCHIDDSAQDSGATMTWKYFHGSKPVPRLLQYVKDQDLWQFRLPHSKEVNAAINLQVTRAGDAAWDKAHETFERAGDGLPPEILQAGQAVTAFEQRIVDNAVKNAMKVRIGKYVVPCVNSTACVSEIGNILAQGQAFAMTWSCNRKDKTIKCSLRSSEGGADVSQVASAMGGGGHPRAAGAELDAPPAPLRSRVSRSALEEAIARIRQTPVVNEVTSEVGKQALAAYRKNFVDYAGYTARETQFAGRAARAVNASVMADEIASKLATDKQLGIAWSHLPNGKFLYVIGDGRGALHHEIYDAPPP